MLPIVSVIIPTYNRADTIIDSINSILCQTYQSFEVIVVDDGSNDNTKDVVMNIDDSRVKYIYQDNARQAAARNTGIGQAKGKYIAFLDSDDLFLPNKLEIQVQYLEDHPDIGLLYSGYIFRDSKNSVEVSYQPTLTSPSVLEIMRKMEISTASVIIPRSVFDVVGLFDTTLGGVEDLEFWVRIAHDFQIASLSEPLVVIRVDSFNPNRNVERRLNNSLQVWNKIFKNKYVSVNWVERRRLYGLLYYISLVNIRDSLSSLPDNITISFILRICLLSIYFEPFNTKAYKIIFHIIKHQLRYNR